MVGEGATGDQLAKAYLGELRQQFGKAVKVPDEFQWEWLSIPHIFASPFYCYAYSFGNLLVLALYRMYKEQGATFVPKYLELLETGGSEAPRDILAKVGVDMTAEALAIRIRHNPKMVVQLSNPANSTIPEQRNPLWLGRGDKSPYAPY